jgi:hypothetical protein
MNHAPDTEARSIRRLAGILFTNSPGDEDAGQRGAGCTGGSLTAPRNLLLSKPFHTTAPGERQLAAKGRLRAAMTAIGDHRSRSLVEHVTGIASVERHDVAAWARHAGIAPVARHVSCPVGDSKDGRSLRRQRMVFLTSRDKCWNAQAWLIVTLSRLVSLEGGCGTVEPRFEFIRLCACFVADGRGRSVSL